MLLKLAELTDIEKIVSHDIRHMKEPGFNGLPAHPFYPDFEWDIEKKIQDLEKRFGQEIKKPHWGRSLVAYDKENIIGHLNLKGEIATAMHRAKLGMGIEASYRGTGLGSQLMKMGIEFCLENKIEYIDLSVFSHNTPARNLYKKFGFKEVAIFSDWIRMYDQSIDDVQMMLKL